MKDVTLTFEQAIELIHMCRSSAEAKKQRDGRYLRKMTKVQRELRADELDEHLKARQSMQEEAQKKAQDLPEGAPTIAIQMELDREVKEWQAAGKEKRAYQLSNDTIEFIRARFWALSDYPGDAQMIVEATEALGITDEDEASAPEQQG